jgi:HK97 family phage prohead protease
MSDTPSVFTAPLIRFAPDIELVRGGDGRTVRGIIVPWDTVAQVQDVEEDGPYYEAFRAGAFDEWIAAVGVERVKFLGHHKRDANPLGRATLLRNDAAGQYGEFYVSRTGAGDEMLELVRDGVLDAFSIGFSPVNAETVGDVTYRTRANLNETSIVTFPAYADARVAGVRNAPDLPTLLAAHASGAGESSVTDGSGDPAGSERTGMTPNERDRAIALSTLRKVH